jgi:hypothetical protein
MVARGARRAAAGHAQRAARDSVGRFHFIALESLPISVTSAIVVDKVMPTAPRHHLLCALSAIVLLTGLPAGCHRAPEPERDLKQFVAEEKSLYSQAYQEVLIRHFFKDKRDGFYVDVGA